MLLGEDADWDVWCRDTGFTTFWTDLPFNLLQQPVMLEELRYRFPELDPLLERTGLDDGDAGGYQQS